MPDYTNDATVNFTITPEENLDVPQQQNEPKSESVTQEQKETSESKPSEQPIKSNIFTSWFAIIIYIFIIIISISST
ncbi:hypothetical protein ['Camptotheca acuminata' phytoplasma]|uniref:hypothetical protein n=1 Tax='Camptotheca acuminata' phytoplasma TaxID=3239192 RepID=UPI003519FC6D